MKLCSVEECGRKHAAHGLCHKHYLRGWSKGEFGGQNRAKCSVCSDPVRAHGLCPLHAMRFYRNGTTESLHRSGCSYPGCPDKHYALGLCRPHYMLFYSIRRADKPRKQPVYFLPARPAKELIEREYPEWLERRSTERGVAVSLYMGTNHRKRPRLLLEELGISVSTWNQEEWTDKLIDKVFIYFHTTPHAYYPEWTQLGVPA